MGCQNSKTISLKNQTKSRDQNISVPERPQQHRKEFACQFSGAQMQQNVQPAPIYELIEALLIENSNQSGSDIVGSIQQHYKNKENVSRFQLSSLGSMNVIIDEKPKNYARKVLKNKSSNNFFENNLRQNQALSEADRAQPSKAKHERSQDKTEMFDSSQGGQFQADQQISLPVSSLLQQNKPTDQVLDKVQNEHEIEEGEREAESVGMGNINIMVTKVYTLSSYKKNEDNLVK